mgnify:CR=1 FL=1
MSFHSYMIIEGEKLFSLKSYKNLKKNKKSFKKSGQKCRFIRI